MNKRLIVYPFLLGAGAVLIGSGCSKFLNKDIKGVYPAGQFYTTSDAAVQAVNEAYVGLTFTSGTANPLWVFGDVASDDAASGDPAASPDAATIDNFSFSTTNSHLSNEWSNFYEGITNCNLVLANVPPINMDTVLRSRVVAEARFLRAWYYFMLVNIYGDVPVVLTPLNPAQMQVAQSPAKQIYEGVIEPDLKAALRTLPSGYGSADIGRATSGAAASLLAKVYLYQEKWDSSLVYSTQVISSGLYSLMPVYSQNFDGLHKNNAESVFEVQMIGGQNPNVGNALNQWFAPQVVGGYYCDAPNSNFVNEFDSTPSGVHDPRLDYTVGRDSMKWNNGDLYLSSWSPQTGYLNRKHQQPLSQAPIIGQGNCDYVAIRYADVLLFNAEALNELGQPTAAIAPLNQVRKRARESYLYDSSLQGYGAIPPALLPNVPVVSQGQVRSAIIHERRVELGFEFHRFFDLMRYAANPNIGPSNVNLWMNRDGVSGYAYSAATKSFPIPQSEKDIDKALH
ncbi:MAG: RagB/SusD family nutrient uptake outer membrane protein [Bacteroidota bacterium]|nr:RagB/SusD family nutrient uptake outer membrane protein [Bacteroidota bacterium]MDP4254514.1 RagB/SusD family nutrient uptake outer membrane protein [Bacteroidota bacterium]MDP4260673.1 RagB/SusD family nutrient uptake outer membrane protein [Bacteroidota bacterium]